MSQRQHYDAEIIIIKVLREQEKKTSENLQKILKKER
jgi:hypothetical protein